MAMDVFHYQAVNNSIYKLFINNLGKNRQDISSLEEIPFLPVEFFRSHVVITGREKAETFFESTGTTGMVRSRHYVTDPGLYDRSLLKCFRMFYGSPEDYLIVALLPSYLERPASSLVYMIRRLIDSGADKRSGFFMSASREMLDLITGARDEGKKVILAGVSFALLDLAVKYPADLSGVVIIETGGMKGRRKEITRTELHEILKSSFNVPAVHSEYGMTELLSQAWSDGNGIFRCPPWMKVMVREINDPLAVTGRPWKTGGINIVDLANINSCSFIATGDIGKLHEGGRFEVLGRFDHSETRGCNLMVE